MNDLTGVTIVMTKIYTSFKHVCDVLQGICSSDEMFMDVLLDYLLFIAQLFVV